MSSTRKAKDGSIYQQSRYASSEAFERGLIANLVARRCSILDDAADRELVWFLQYLSHRDGGISALADALIAKYPQHNQTREMLELGAKPGKKLNAEQVRKIRRILPLESRAQFPLKGDFTADEMLEALVNSREDSGRDIPNDYPAAEFFEHCRAAAATRLENYLCDLCLNPETGFDSGPWYFHGLITALRDYKADWTKAKSSGVFTTELGKKVCEVLDYTVYSRGLSFMEGDPRLGKSFAARAWCDQHPGQARFIEVPDGNDDASFYRDIARGLGLGSFLNYKVVQIRERVESVLRSGDITLVLDEAQRLFPQTHFRAGYPKRVVWVMTMAGAGVPICMIGTPQFFSTLKVIEKNGWSSAQLIGRIDHTEMLPSELSVADLISVAKSVLPEADSASLKALALYARASARYLAAIDSVAKRARYIAMKAQRSEVTTDDVRKAMQESVIPADTKLHRALGNVSQGKQASRTAAPVATDAEPMEAPDRNIAGGRREVAPTFSGSRSRAENSAPLIEA